MKITVDRAKCKALGVCESLEPDRFEVNEEGSLEIHVEAFEDSERPRMEEVVRSCPSGALSLTP